MPKKEDESNQDPGELKEFLNPKSMLTPGACGALTLLITNTLAAQFGAPPNYTGLGISCIFGLIVLFTTTAARWLKLVFWLLNSLIIFSIALGTNQIGVNPATSLKLAAGSASANVEATHFKAVFFANWLDGTVPRRTKLLGDVKKLDQAQAKEVLGKLGLYWDGRQSPNLVLGDWVARARTAEMVALSEDAISSSKLRLRDHTVTPMAPASTSTIPPQATTRR